VKRARRRSKLGLSPILLLLGPFATFGSDIESVLPKDFAVSPWQATGERLRYEANDLYRFIDGAAEIYHAYGFVRVLSQEYLLGDDALVVSVYEMSDPEAAFGIFSYHRSLEKEPVPLGDGGFRDIFQLAFWQDRYFVLVESYSADGEVERARDSFARRLSDNIGRRAGEPSLLNRLGRKGLVRGSEKILKGRPALDALYFVSGSGAWPLDDLDRLLYGEYRGRAGETRLYLIVLSEEARAGSLFERTKDGLGRAEGFRLVEERGARATWFGKGRYLLADAGEGVLALADAPSLEDGEAVLGVVGGSW
jgi:hypothetical protein